MKTRKQIKQWRKANDRRKRIAKHRNIQNNNRDIWDRTIPRMGIL